MMKCLSIALSFILAVTTIISCGPSTTDAYSLLENDYGEMMPPMDVRSLAMGRTSIASSRSPVVTCTNPALLATLGGISFELTGGGVNFDERRSFPVHDSFSSYLAENVYAQNSNHFFSGGGALCLDLNFLLGAKNLPALAVGYFPLYDFNFDYREEVRDNYSFAGDKDALLGHNWITSTGYVAAYNVGIAGNVLDWFQIGASCNFLTGDLDCSHGVSYEKDDPDLIDLLTQGEKSLEGTAFIFGLSKSLGSRFRFGWNCELPSEITTDSEGTSLGSDTTTVELSRKITYPMSMGLGFQYSPRNELRTNIAADIIYEFWSDFKIDDRKMNLGDIMHYHIGLEHIFYDGIPLWLGFSYIPSWKDTGILSSILSVGTGFSVSGALIKVGGEFGWRVYRHRDLFPDSLYDEATASEVVDRTELDRVEERTLGGYISIQYDFTI